MGDQGLTDSALFASQLRRIDRSPLRRMLSTVDQLMESWACAVPDDAHHDWRRARLRARLRAQ
jgi:hypothetical protein